MLIVENAMLTRWRDYVAAGAEHILIGVGSPFDLTPVERLLAQVRADR